MEEITSLKVAQQALRDRRAMAASSDSIVAQDHVDQDDSLENSGDGDLGDANDDDDVQPYVAQRTARFTMPSAARLTTTMS
jgi:hypothetical protein